MTQPLLALQAAIVATLNGDAELVALLGGAKTYEQAPAATIYPWIAFEEMRARDNSVSDFPGHELRVSLLCVSRQPGSAEALTIAARVVELLDDANLTLDGHRLIHLAATSVDLIRAGKDPVRKARISLRAVTETI
ncbi:DUF3168 domain-containing protein [Terrarubrum flagellatum]|uniref:DUF3168 domain-containing protein n=1 Tax=Terrirubrum flagellatum TaxID=2895980 RepID=UPI003144FD27